MQENNEVKSIRLDEIIPNKLQPRTNFDNEKLNELALSIKQYGIINPIILRKKDNRYEIVAGERRYRASKLLGLETIPARIIEADDKTSAEIAIIENIQREDLSIIEEARSYRKLVDVCGITQAELAQKLGKSQGTIANKMRLLNLCDEVQEALMHNKISERHARALLQLNNVNDQRELLEKIISQKLSVKNTETEIKNIINETSTTSETKDMPVSNNITNNLNENMYGNDIVSIDDLNKKEIEKDDIIMNEQNINVNPTVVTNPTTEPINNEQNMGAATPAFGERFFPSLEDQPTNVGMNDAFPSAPTEATAQPMMENLVDSTTIENESMPAIEEPIPAPVAEPVAPVVETPVSETIESAVASVEESPTIEMPTFVTNSENAPQINPTIEMPTTGAPSTAPVAEPVQPAPEVPVMETPIETPTAPIVDQPVMEQSAPVPSFEEPVPAPVTEPAQPTPEIPAMEISEPVMDTATTVPTQGQTGDVLAAMNAIKNLALSIQSIGYNATINEENEADKYRITIELQK